MKKLTLLFFLFVLQISIAQTEWFASPSGTPTGNGSMANPWDLQTAFTNASNLIQPGHTLWLRGGVYRGQFDCWLQGTETQPITVQSYCGETAILNGNTIYPTPLTPNPNPPLVNPNPGIQKRLRKFYWSLDPEQKAEFYKRAEENPNLSQNGLFLINLPRPAVLNIKGGFVHFKKFEITCLDFFERDYAKPNFFNLDGIYNHEPQNENCKFIELVIYNLPGTGVDEWKEAKGSEYNSCLVYNNGYYDTLRGHGPAFYVQNIHNEYKLFKKNIAFSNLGSGFELWSASSTVGSVTDFVKNFKVYENIVFDHQKFYDYIGFKPNIFIGACSFSPRNAEFIKNFLYQTTTFTTGQFYQGVCFSFGGDCLTYPVRNVKVENNFLAGRNATLRIQNAIATDTEPIIFRYNTVYSRVNEINSSFNMTNFTNPNWIFDFNDYYAQQQNGDRLYNFSGGGQLNFSTIQAAPYFKELNSTRTAIFAPLEKIEIIKFEYSPNKFSVAIVKNNIGTSNYTADISSFISGIPTGTPYRIIDVENYHAEMNLPFSNIYTGTPITFNMQSTAFEPPLNLPNTPYGANLSTATLKSPANFGCFIIEFDLCTNTTAALTLPTETCATAGALTNLAQYVNNAPANGIFSGTGVQQIGGEYVFNAATAGAGTHTLTYTFQTPGCCQSNTITANITVTDCLQKPYISQTYYNDTDKFIEVKNSSDTQSIHAGNYYLVLYENNAATNVAPTKYINLGAIAPQGVKVWKAQNGGNLGYVTATDWLDLNGYDGVDDIVILTTTIDTNSYANRIDAFGKANFNAFNDNITLQTQASFVRMSCAPAIPTPTYNQEHWVYFTGTEVANSNSKTNAELGRHYNEILVFRPNLDVIPLGYWDEDRIINNSPNSNESLPDRSRSVEFQHNYSTANYASFEVCSLKINPFVVLTINTSNYVKVFTSISVEPDGKLEVLNQGSLVMVYDCYNGTCGIDLIDLGAMATMQADKQTVGINGPNDYVYWSSPLSTAVTNPTINQVFLFGTTTGLFNANRFYIFENANFYDQLATYGNNGSGTDGYDDNFDDYNPLNTVAEQTAPFIPGRGYATWPPINDIDGYNVSFTGEMNNGEVTVPVYRNNSVLGANPNLVGNPYPSAIDLDVLFAENSNLIEPLAFIWGRAIIDDPNNTNTGPNQFNYQEDNYQIYNPTMIIDPVFNGNTPFNSEGILASCQSFFVRAKDPVGGYAVTNTGLIEQAGNLVFKNKMRTTLPNTTFARIGTNSSEAVHTNAASQNDKLWVNVTDNAGYTVQLGVAFMPNANQNFVQGEDIKVINGRKYNFYTQSTSEDLIIDVQDAFNENKVIPLGITNTSENAQIMFSISIPKKEGIFNTQTIYLYDALLNAYHNLSNGAYNFTTNAAVIENRFSLVFTTNSTIFTKEATESDVRVFAQNGMIKVASNGKKIVNVEVFDIYTANTSGVSIANKEKIHALEIELFISNLYRLLSVKVQLEDGSIITKKIMK